MSPKDLNQYTYVGGNPASRVDPSGRCDAKNTSCPSGSELLGAAVGVGDALTAPYAPFTNLNPFVQSAAKRKYFFNGGVTSGILNNGRYISSSRYRADLSRAGYGNFSLKLGGYAFLVYDAGDTYLQAREALENDDPVAAGKVFGKFAAGSVSGYLGGSAAASACVASALVTGPVGPAVCLIGGVLVGATVSHFAGAAAEIIIDPETWKIDEAAKQREAEILKAQRSLGYLPNIGRTIDDAPAILE